MLEPNVSPEAGLGDHKVAHHEKNTLKPTGSPVEPQLGELQENRNGQFHRSFSPRQVHVSDVDQQLCNHGQELIIPQVISLGSNIGSGVFIATGKALATGGPGNMIIAYALVCSCVWGVLQSLSEMTIAFPVSGNYIDYADRWVDPALAFGAGFAEWLGPLLTSSSYFPCSLLTGNQGGRQL